MNIEIDTGHLKSDAGRMHEQLVKVRDALNEMHDAISVLSGMWQGEAKNTFVTQYAYDYENMSDVCNIVEKIIEGMNTAADKYGRCDTEIKNIVEGLRI